MQDQSPTTVCVSGSAASTGFDPDYEINRVRDESAFFQKLRTKRRLFKLVGEVYIGKRVKLAYFYQWLRDIVLPASATVLEVGSGDGLFTFAAAAFLPRAKVIGMELNPAEAKACQRIVESEGLTNARFVPGLLADQKWVDEYDLVFCLDVLEHIKDDVAALKEMLEVMKPGAILLIHVPRRYFMDTDNVIHTVSDDEAWRINPGHVRNGYEPEELKVTLEMAGFAVREIRESQGRPIAMAHQLYSRFEHPSWARILILPLIDRLIRKDQKHQWIHGNSLWAYASKPISL